MHVSRGVSRIGPDRLAMILHGLVEIALALPLIGGVAVDEREIALVKPAGLEEARAGLDGDVAARRGDYDRAIADHTEAIRVDPAYANGFYNRGLTYSRKSDHQRACRLRCGVRADENSRSCRLALCPRRDQIEKGRHRGRQRGHSERKGNEGRHRGKIRDVRDQVDVRFAAD